MWVFNSYGCGAYCRQMTRIYNYLGKYLYSLLEDVELPSCHPTLNSSILLLIRGCSLPKGHPSIEEILKDALGCTTTTETTDNS